MNAEKFERLLIKLGACDQALGREITMSLMLAYQLVRNICRFVYEYIEENRIPPTVEEIARQKQALVEAEGEAKKPKPFSLLRVLGYVILGRSAGRFVRAAVQVRETK